MSEFRNIKNTAQQATVDPPSELWTKLSGRMDKEKIMSSRSRNRRLQYGGLIAASFLIILGAFYVVHEASHIADKQKGHIAGWEDLHNSSSLIYDTGRLHTLHNAYASLEEVN